MYCLLHDARVQEKNKIVLHWKFPRA
jgi:hypothetical protein